MLTTLLRLAQHESITTATFYAQLAVALYPQSEPALFQLATLLVQQGQTPHAVYLLTTPDHAPTHSASTRAALLYAQHLQPHLALNHLQQLLPLPPTEPLPPPFPSDHATLQLATLNLKLDQPFQAIQLFTSLLHQDHLHWEAMHQLAKLGQPPNLDQLFPISVHDNSLKPIIPLFTPVQPPIPRGKRARTPRANAPPPVIEQPSVPTKRAVKGVPVQPRSLVTPVQSTSSLPAAVGAAQVRRSTRLSRELSASYEANTPAAPPPRKAVAGSSSILPPTSSRITKRSKSGQGPTVLSDTGTPSLTDALSPRSRLSSSPAPSSPARPSSDAERYLNDIVRSFAKAEIAAAAYESRKTLDALNELPIKVQRAERAMMMRGRAHFELLEYDKAEVIFAALRVSAPFLTTYLSLYSTLLWHLRKLPTLSFLAQSIMISHPLAPSAWVASGNVFSHLEDHTSALKCFKRASQLAERDAVECEGCYALTLSGHECVTLEHWEAALEFFREAVRLEPGMYNAWFGIGNVYMQTGKYRLAEYHFRKAVSLNPSNAMLVCCVGAVMEKLGNKEEALDIYERAEILAPASAAVRFKRVRMLISLSRFTEALPPLLQLSNTAPNEFNVLFLLGKLHLRLGEKSEAVRWFARAQEVDPRSAGVLRAELEGLRLDGEEGDTVGELTEDVSMVQ